VPDKLLFFFRVNNFNYLSYFPVFIAIISPKKVRKQTGKLVFIEQGFYVPG